MVIIMEELMVKLIVQMKSEYPVKSLSLYDWFFNKFKSLDMDNIDDVVYLIDSFKKWSNWNKGSCEIEVFEALDTIIIVHNLFTDTKIEDSWEFINDITYILDMYGDTDENFFYMVDFWVNEVNL